MANKVVLTKLKNNQAYKLTFRHISVIFEVQLNYYTAQVLLFQVLLDDAVNRLHYIAPLTDK
jgi:hypothetical protein